MRSASPSPRGSGIGPGRVAYGRLRCTRFQALDRVGERGESGLREGVAQALLGEDVAGEEPFVQVRVVVRPAPGRPRGPAPKEGDEVLQDPAVGVGGGQGRQVDADVAFRAREQRRHARAQRGSGPQLQDGGRQHGHAVLPQQRQVLEPDAVAVGGGSGAAPRAAVVQGPLKARYPGQKTLDERSRVLEEQRQTHPNLTGRCPGHSRRPRRVSGVLSLEAASR